VKPEGGEEAMTDRILEWLRLEHDDPELRTGRVIAAMLEMDRDDVRSGLSVLEREGTRSIGGWGVPPPYLSDHHSHGLA